MRLGVVALSSSFVVFVVPFVFICSRRCKDPAGGLLLQFTWPTTWQLWENLVEVVQARNYMLLIAFINSTILTVGRVVTLLVIFGDGGYVAAAPPGTLEQRRDRLPRAVGLIVPPAVVPTIWVLQGLGLFKTIHGMILIEVAYGLSFSVLLYRAFIATIPRELDEAAIIDGAKPLRAVLPGDPAAAEAGDVTLIVVQSVAIFNDFTNPLYFLPGNENVTVQLTLFNFQSQFSTPVQPAVHEHPADHDPAADHVHLLQPPDRRGHDRRRGEGLTLCAT